MPKCSVVPAAPRGRDVVFSAVESPGMDPAADPFRSLLEKEAPPSIGPGTVAVVIDVLRATTTLTVARAHGALAVIPAGTIAEARAFAAARPGALLCGERDGRLVAGFDLGNSPFEYTRTRVAGKTLVFASTNGSQALRLAAGAKHVWIGAFVNATAVLERVAGETDVVLIASGKLGEPAGEDLACAGWLVRALRACGYAPGNAAAELAEAKAPRDAGEVRELVEHCAHASMLEEIGPAFVRDVEYCATLDAIDGAWAIGESRG